MLDVAYRYAMVYRLKVPQLKCRWDIGKHGLKISPICDAPEEK